MILSALVAQMALAGVKPKPDLAYELQADGIY